jgi:toxin-antitoxin system PIN domain toxin
MIVPDVNLLVYAHNRAAAGHEQARMWWKDLIDREHPVGLPWAVMLGFVRLTTNPSVLAAPLAALDSLALVREWLDQPSVRVVEPGPRHLDLLAGLFRSTGVAGNLTTDTHLAALAMEHQAELHSNDGDFARFPGLRWHNPIA